MTCLSVLGITHHDRHGICPDSDDDPLGRRALPQQADRCIHCRGQIDLLFLHDVAPRFDPGDVQDIIDQRQQVTSTLVDITSILEVFRRTERTIIFTAHDLGEADHRVERRAEFMAHPGQEFRLGLVGLLGGEKRQIGFPPDTVQPVGKLDEVVKLPVQAGQRRPQLGFDRALG